MSDCEATPKNDGHLGYTDTLILSIIVLKFKVGKLVSEEGEMTVS